MSCAIKHARARQLLIRFAHDGGGYRLTVRDDGAGFDPHGEFVGHFGLIAMRQRAGCLGGRLAVVSEPGAGAEIAVWLPPAR